MKDSRIEFGLSIDKYHAHSSISKSGLDLIHRSPLHYFGNYLDPLRPGRKSKSGQLEGTLAHCAILEPQEFDKRHKVGPSVNRNTKEWKAFADSLPCDVDPIQQNQRDTAFAQAESVFRIDQIRQGLSRGVAETSAFWRDEDTGVMCRCRPDWVHPVSESGVILFDVKTFASASPGPFMRQAAQKRYAVQAAMYSEGYAKASGLEVLGFVFVVVETEWPYVASAMMLDEKSMENGLAEYRADLATYADCLKTNHWPGISEGVQVVSLPNWAFLPE